MWSELFANLPHTERVFAPGAAVFHRGDAVERLHVVRSGSIRLVRHQEDGYPVVLQRACRGDILAEASVYSPHYHCDAVALTESETDAFAVSDIRQLLDTDIGFCRAWAAAMSHQLQAARRRAELMSLRTVSERLDFWLAWNEGGMPEGIMEGRRRGDRRVRGGALPRILGSQEAGDETSAGAVKILRHAA